jgi:hypothetical protein
VNRRVGAMPPLGMVRLAASHRTPPPFLTGLGSLRAGGREYECTQARWRRPRPLDGEKWPLQAKRPWRCKQSPLTAVKRPRRVGMPLEPFYLWRRKLQLYRFGHAGLQGVPATVLAIEAPLVRSVTLHHARARPSIRPGGTRSVACGATHTSAAITATTERGPPSGSVALHSLRTPHSSSLTPRCRRCSVTAAKILLVAVRRELIGRGWRARAVRGL